MALRRHEIQDIYLAIQENLGKLIDEAGAVEKKSLAGISVLLLNVKRNMIGTFDEVSTTDFEVNQSGHSSSGSKSNQTLGRAAKVNAL